MARKPKRDMCVMAGCDREALPRGPLCNRCKSWVRYWKGKPRAQFMKRIGQIDFWSKRAHGTLNVQKKK